MSKPSRLGASLLASLAFSGLLAPACGTPDSATGGTAGGGGQAACGKILQRAQPPIPHAPDGATACAGNSCNYQTQEGCDPTLSCRPLFPAGSTTVSAGCEPFGAGKSGDHCGTSADCARGFLCVTTLPSPDNEVTPSIRRCFQQCCAGDWSACGPGESCIRQFEVAFPNGNREHPLDLCVPVNNCDPFDPNACKDDPDPPARECKIADPTGAVACMPVSSLKLGDECSLASARCAQGFTCVDDPVPGHAHCRRLCRAEVCGQPGCPSGEGDCVHFLRDPVGIGECTVEQ